jgi:hypothetical protein
MKKLRVDVTPSINGNSSPGPPIISSAQAESVSSTVFSKIVVVSAISSAASSGLGGEPAPQGSQGEDQRNNQKK